MRPPGHQPVGTKGGISTLGQSCTEGGGQSLKTIRPADPDRRPEVNLGAAPNRPSVPSGKVSVSLGVLCQKVTDHLGAQGAAVVLITHEGGETTLGSSNGYARRMSELEFSMGEGPNRLAFDRARPVLTQDMAAAARTTWPAYAAAAYDAGLGAAFVFPLHVGASSFGVLAIYYSAATTLDQDQINSSLTFAALATEILLDSASPDLTDPFDVDQQTSQEFRSEVYQAQGMVMVALGVDLAEALARMRANAYATEQDLAELAAEIVAGTTQLSNDRS